MNLYVYTSYKDYEQSIEASTVATATVCIEIACSCMALTPARQFYFPSLTTTFLILKA